MSEIKYHAPRLPDEDEVYEVRFTEHRSSGQVHCGSIFFEMPDGDFREVACVMHGTREREDYLPKAAKRLIREKTVPVVYDKDNEVVAELVVNDRYVDTQ